MSLPYSTGEDRLFKLYTAYIRSIMEPEETGVQISHGGDGMHIQGGTLTVYSAKGSRFGTTGPSTALRGFHVTTNAASPIAKISVPSAPATQTSIARAKVSPI